MKFELIKPKYLEDHRWLVSLHNDPLVLDNVTNSSPITLQSHLKWYNSLNPEKSDIMIFTVDDERVGIAKLNPIDKINKSVVMGADIHKDFRGKGYATKLWNLMIDRSINEHECHRLSLTTAVYNDIGRHLYGKLGFKEEGRLIESLCRDGRFYDQICMYRLAE